MRDIVPILPISIMVYIFQFIFLSFGPAGISFLLYKKLHFKRKMIGILFCLSFVFEMLGVLWLTQHPLWSCPEEYQKYVSELEKSKIISLNSGIYSPELPLFPVCIYISYADSVIVTADTYYLFIGRTIMSINNEGYVLPRNP